MNKRVKTGPVLVIVALVVLVGAAMMLTPAPPPAQEEAEHDHEAESTGLPKEEPEKPKVNLAELRKLLKSSDPHAQTSALDLLAQHYLTTRGPEKTELSAMVRDLSLKGATTEVRTAALAMLRSFGETPSSFFVKLARTDPSPDVRESAVSILGTFPNDPEAAAVIKAARNDPDPGMRAVAGIAWVAYLMGSGQAGDEELCALLGKFDNDMAAKAAMALQQRGPQVVRTVEKVLYTSKSGPQRHGAAMVIALACKGFNPSIEQFARAAQATHRQDAGHIKADLSGLKPLLWALQHDDYAPTREVAAQGLGYLGAAEAAKPLAAALQDKDPLVRRRAAAALITVPAETVIPELSAAATRDRDPAVRQFAAEALGWIGKPEVVPALIQATRDPSANVRRNAAIQLGKLADPSSLDALADMLDDTPDEDPDVRWAAVVALGKLRDRRAEHVLVKCLSDPSPQVQNSAERALQRLGIARREEAGFRS
ncbi:MAG: hypothetical protein HPY69_07235 [Armatimonadetes bacterium]|nr:hypothetical protein [Armatimonadota bacterium]